LVLKQALGKTDQKPGFSIKSKEAVPKTEVLEQPHLKTGATRLTKKPITAIFTP
jgi:hypothetical protein